jgi:peptidoglycan/xylan/chitin deacetylase (PgdA/CDA1 family)
VLKTRALLYHDVIPEGSPSDSSGFGGASASAYKLSHAHFHAHLSEVQKAAPEVASVGKTVHELLEADQVGGPHVLITFDDGGVSAISETAPYLESLGWRGHYFIATDFVGKRGFLSEKQIRELDRRGHAIGSHSCSHPLRMADLTKDELHAEWRQSVAVLAAILDRPVELASVPGGMYTTEVGIAARESGVKILFTSEPEQTVGALGDLTLVGRYSVVRKDPPQYAHQLASGAQMALQKQWMLWNAKKIAKRVAGGSYMWARERYFKRRI